jgi:hypothetical protein
MEGYAHAPHLLELPGARLSVMHCLRHTGSSYLQRNGA